MFLLASLNNLWFCIRLSFFSIFRVSEIISIIHCVCVCVCWCEIMSIIVIVHYISLTSYCYCYCYFVFFLNTHHMFVWFEHGPCILYIHSNLTMLTLWILMINHGFYIHFICSFELMILVTLFRPLLETSDLQRVASYSILIESW
jgi:hypothetical protein